MLVVLLNSIWIGLEADAPHKTNMSELGGEQMAVEHIFCVVFTAEIASSDLQRSDGREMPGKISGSALTLHW